jgi:ubiquinone/menaquinone biosynthesis methyltransferase
VNIENALSDPITKRRLNQSLFSIVAPRYAMITRGLSFFRDHAWKKRLVGSLSALGAGSVVIDLATGPGDIARMVAQKYPQARIMGCDLTIAMLRSAHQGAVPENALFSNQDMATLAVKPASADCITGGYALRNAPDLALTLAECSRVLKIGGTAAFLDFSKSPFFLPAFIQITVLKAWGGLWGLLLHGKPWVYGYIGDSLKHFPNRPELRAAFEKAGFIVEFSRLFMMGMIELIVVRKGPR